jgi:hypothetical protein
MAIYVHIGHEISCVVKPYFGPVLRTHSETIYIPNLEVGLNLT